MNAVDRWKVLGSEWKPILHTVVAVVVDDGDMWAERNVVCFVESHPT